MPRRAGSRGPGSPVRRTAEVGRTRDPGAIAPVPTRGRSPSGGPAGDVGDPTATRAPCPLPAEGVVVAPLSRPWPHHRGSMPALHRRRVDPLTIPSHLDPPPIARRPPRASLLCTLAHRSVTILTVQAGIRVPGEPPIRGPPAPKRQSGPAISRHGSLYSHLWRRPCCKGHRGPENERIPTPCCHSALLLGTRTRTSEGYPVSWA